MKDTYCIICGNKRKGIAVKDDYVIETIRWFKKTVTKNEKGNGLVVCKECYSEYKKKHGKYKSRQALYLALGVIFVVFTLLLSFSLAAVGVSIAVLVVLFLISLLSYVPDLAIDAKEKAKTDKQKQ